MLPADGILRAAQRWLGLLARSTFAQAAALIRSDPAYADHSQTQYANALEWLLSVGLLVQTPAGPAPGAAAQRLNARQAGRLVFTTALEEAAPAWLPDSDALVPDAGELPADAAGLAMALGLTDREALLAVRQVHGKIDLAERSRVGAAGELALIDYLELRWPGSTRHVSVTDDGLGYDIEFTRQGTTWHLEVKSTTRRGRLTIHLSRHEHEVAKLDPDWRLVVIGLDGQDKAAAIAIVDTAVLLDRSPRDLYPNARWDSVRHQLSPADLRIGLPFVGSISQETPLHAVPQHGVSFAWMPGAS